MPDDADHRYAQAHSIHYGDRYKYSSLSQQHHRGHVHSNVHRNRYNAPKYNLQSSPVYDNSPYASRSLLFGIAVMSIEFIMLCVIVGMSLCGLLSGFILFKFVIRCQKAKKEEPKDNNSVYIDEMC